MTCRRTGPGCCGCGSRPRWHARSPSGRCRLSARDGRRARSAGCRLTLPGTSARGRTATGPVMPDRPAGRPAGRGQRASSADQQDATEAAALDLLSQGTIEVEGRLVVASNATLYCTIRRGGREANCVYKPVAGERPLWDFPAGSLAGREIAAYLISTAGGFGVVPPTVFRDGPFGPGMCQLWIHADESVDVIALARHTDHAALRDMAVFDAVVNNADRKIGHLLPAPDGHLYGCDHGVCFGEEYKLRTVLWQWRGQKLPGRALTALGKLNAELDGGALATTLEELLSPEEVAATRSRIELLIEHRVHPYPPEN